MCSVGALAPAAFFLPLAETGVAGVPPAMGGDLAGVGVRCSVLSCRVMILAVGGEVLR